MLVQFKVSNYRSFNEGQTLSMVAGSGRDKSHPENLIAPEVVGTDKFRLLKTAAIYGANASGKSNLIKAVRVMRRFILESATRMTEGEAIYCATPFKLSSGSQDQPSSFEVALIADSIRYVYSFAVTRQRVEKETLTAYAGKGSKGQCWLDRNWDSAKEKAEWKFYGPLRSSGRFLEERTRQNALALSRAAQENVPEVKPLFSWFLDKVGILDLSEQMMKLSGQALAQISTNVILKEQVERLLHEADFGIDSLAVGEGLPVTAGRSPGEDEAPGDVKDLLKVPNWIVDALRTKVPRLRAIHKGAEPSSWEAFDFFAEESKGTQRFFGLAVQVLMALEGGHTVIADELDCSMHPLLTRKVIELFNSEHTNRKGAQLVFVTHDTTLMNKALFRRDQIWIAEKRNSGASELFSLHDFKSKPRLNEAFWRGYLDGRYGGIPKFGPRLENVRLD